VMQNEIQTASYIGSKGPMMPSGGLKMIKSAWPSIAG
jgi:hypothetical protein